jgi:predicted nuclease with TOPRIM domain
LEFIAFYHTRVKHVDDGAFDHLKKLTTLYFENNICHNENAITNRLAVLALINIVEAKCKDFAYVRNCKDSIYNEELIEARLSGKDNKKSNLLQSSNLEQSMVDNLAAIDNEVSKLKEEIATLKNEMSLMKKNFGDFNDVMSQCNSKP